MKVLSPFLPHRELRQERNTVVLHATAGSSVQGAIQTLRKRGLSYHYIIDKDGSITKCIPFKSEGFHAGKSRGPKGEWVNRYSVGISFVNLNNGRDPYPLPQFEACARLLKELKAAEPGLKYLTTHRIISPGRKTDPINFLTQQMAQETGFMYWKP